MKGNIWESPNVFLYDTDCFACWDLADMPIDAIPNAINRTSLSLNGEVEIEYVISSKSKSYKIVSNRQSPKYYWLVMIRGDAYNYLTARCVLDGGYKVIKFKDEKAYYKLIIPIWED